VRYRLDDTWERPTPDRRVILAGSPLRVFRVTEAGSRVCDRIETGDDVPSSTLTERFTDAGAIHPRPDRSGAPADAEDVPVVTPQLGGRSALDDRDVTVDDGSPTPIIGAHVRLDVNRGPGGARNAGRRSVDAEFIAFVDADVTIGPGWLDDLLPHFADERVGLVAPRVIGDPSASLDLGAQPARISASTRVSYVPAAALVVRAAAFDDVGGFDEALRFGEDVDLVWRLDEAGWRCRYEPSVTVGHAPRTGPMARARQQIGYGSAAAPLALRHPRSLAPVRANGWMVLGWVSIIAVWPPGVVASIAGNCWFVHRRVDVVPPARLIRLVVDSNLEGLRNVASSIRREWWPVALIASLISRRARCATLVAFVIGARSAVTDVAYGWGVWTGIRRHRTWRPVVPHIARWKPEGGSRQPG
jgi:mycofactocin system glycosyltransferase